MARVLCEQARDADESSNCEGKTRVATRISKIDGKKVKLRQTASRESSSWYYNIEVD